MAQLLAEWQLGKAPVSAVCTSVEDEHVVAAITDNKVLRINLRDKEPRPEPVLISEDGPFAALTACLLGFCAITFSGVLYSTSGLYLKIGSEEDEICALISRSHFLFIGIGCKVMAVNLTDEDCFVHCHHAADVSALTISTDGTILISADLAGQIVLANVSKMPKVLTHQSLPEDIADDDALIACHMVEDSVSRLQMLSEDALLVFTGTEQFALLRFTSLSPLPHDSSSTTNLPVHVELIGLNASIRNDPNMTTSARLVTSITNRLTGRTFILASSCDGQLAAFHLSGRASIRFTGNFSVSDDNPTLKGHTDLIRDGVCCGDKHIATVGDDGKICIWG